MRDQLDPGRSERVESGQLAAAGGQSQRKRLHAVPKEIAAGQNVLGLKLMVDFGDEAGQVVKEGRNNRAALDRWEDSVRATDGELVSCANDGVAGICRGQCPFGPEPGSERWRR